MNNLEEEIKHPCENCISREEAVEVIAGADETNGNEPVFSGKQVIKMLNDLPSVTPQRPKGKWIRSWCEWQQYLECSKCGYETGLRCNTNYCPNCGAKMGSEDEK